MTTKVLYVDSRTLKTMREPHKYKLCTCTEIHAPYQGSRTQKSYSLNRAEQFLFTA